MGILDSGIFIIATSKPKLIARKSNYGGKDLRKEEQREKIKEAMLKKSMAFVKLK